MVYDVNWEMSQQFVLQLKKNASQTKFTGVPTSEGGPQGQVGIVKHYSLSAANIIFFKQAVHNTNMFWNILAKNLWRKYSC